MYVYLSKANTTTDAISIDKAELGRHAPDIEPVCKVTILPDLPISTDLQLK